MGPGAHLHSGWFTVFLGAWFGPSLKRLIISTCPLGSLNASLNEPLEAAGEAERTFLRLAFGIFLKL